MGIDPRRLARRIEKIIEQGLRFSVIHTRNAIGMPADAKRLPAGDRVRFHERTKRGPFVVKAVAGAGLDNVAKLRLRCV